MDLIACLIRCLLCIVMVGLCGRRVTARYNICEVEKYTGRPPIICKYCFASPICLPPFTETICNIASAEIVLGNLRRLYPDSRPAFNKTVRFQCITVRMQKADGTKWETRGCMYYNTKKHILKGSFRYMQFYKHVKVGNLNWEKHNRTYWNRSHLNYVHCWYCMESRCNQRLFNRTAPRKHFERPIFARHTKTCVLTVHHDYDKFVRSCRENNVKGHCSSWVWPGNYFTPYHPNVKNIN